MPILIFPFKTHTSLLICFYFPMNLIFFNTLLRIKLLCIGMANVGIKMTNAFLMVKLLYLYTSNIAYRNIKYI